MAEWNWIRVTAASAMLLMGAAQVGLGASCGQPVPAGCTDSEPSCGCARPARCGDGGASCARPAARPNVKVVVCGGVCSQPGGAACGPLCCLPCCAPPPSGPIISAVPILTVTPSISVVGQSVTTAPFAASGAFGAGLFATSGLSGLSLQNAALLQNAGFTGQTAGATQPSMLDRALLEALAAQLQRRNGTAAGASAAQEERGGLDARIGSRIFA